MRHITLCLLLPILFSGCPNQDSRTSPPKAQPAGTQVTFYAEPKCEECSSISQAVKALAPRYEPQAVLGIAPWASAIAVPADGSHVHQIEWPAKTQPVIDLNEVRIKLLWVDKDGRPSSDGKFALLKVGSKVYHTPGALEGEESAQIWESLRQDLLRFKAEYRGGSSDGVPLLLVARKGVKANLVTRALEIMAQVKTGVEPAR